LFERCGQLDKDNVHVISYKRIKHSHLTYGEPEDPWILGVSPLAPITNLLYLNLETFANVVVVVSLLKSRHNHYQLHLLGTDIIGTYIP